MAGQTAQIAAEREAIRSTIAPRYPRARRSAASNASAEDKTDRRVRRTKRQLREALTTLLLKKKFSEITVRELSELADVNRGTFYTHYRDTEDLLEQLESGFLNELRRIDASIQRQDWERGAYSYLEELLRLCRDNADIYLALVCRNDDLGFAARLVSALRQQYLHGFVGHVCRAEQRVQELYCVYIVDGVLSVVTVWLNGGMKETPAQLARISGDFILRGVKGLR